MAKIDPSKIHVELQGPVMGPWHGKAAYSLRVDDPGSIPAGEIVHVVINATFPVAERIDQTKALEEARISGRDHIHRLIKQYRDDADD